MSAIEKAAEAAFGGNREQRVLGAGELPGHADFLENALIRWGELAGDPLVLQRGGMLVQIVPTQPSTALQMASGAPVGRKIVAMSVQRLIELGTLVADWQKPYKSGDGFRVQNCPHEVAATLFERQTWRFPVLTAVVESPTLRPDLSVIEGEGYDADTGLYLHFGGTRFPAINMRPTRDEALAALREFADELLAEFPFASDADRAVALAMILTAIARPALPGAPMFGISAVVMGSGKTYLAHVVSLLLTGRPAAVVAPPKDPAEWDKVLFSLFLDGDVLVLVIDNVEYQLTSDLLCAILTSTSLRGRVLSASRMATVSTAATVICTGNNLMVAGDLSSRTLTCALDPKDAHPEHRRFARDLMRWIPANRGRLVSAALTFLRGFVHAGAPQLAGEPWQRFPEWDRLIRAAIVWAELPDPLLVLRRGEAQDPRRVEHGALMTAWSDANPDCGTMTVRELVKLAQDLALQNSHELKDALLDIAGERGEINVKRVGKWFAKMRGRIQDGLAIEQAGQRKGIALWRVTAG